MNRFQRIWQRLKQEIKVYRLAMADPRTPKAAKWLLRFALAYLLSPLDLIPDAIPILGLFDEVILLPAVLWIARRMIPGEVMRECRLRAARENANR